MTTFDFDFYKTLKPMKYYDKSEGLSPALQQKRQDMIDNKDNKYICTLKNDGEWCMLIRGYGDQVLIRSRSLSKVTGEYGDYTAKLPHIVEELLKFPEGTVILGEVCFDEFGTISTDVGSILRCLPPKAVERQQTKPLKIKAFDLLAYDGNALQDLTYEQRLIRLELFLNSFKLKFISPTTICPDDMSFAEFADNIISQGGEGAVIQLKSNKYENGCRTAWHTLKLKQKLPEQELLVIGTLDPTRTYTGECPEVWKFWCGQYTDDPTSKEVFIDRVPATIDKEANLVWTPVTKPYYYGWKVGVVVDFNGTPVSVSSGLSDEDRAWLATTEAQQQIANKEVYAVIKGMLATKDGSIRHPILMRLRNEVI